MPLPRATRCAAAGVTLIGDGASRRHGDARRDLRAGWRWYSAAKARVSSAGSAGGSISRVTHSDERAVESLNVAVAAASWSTKRDGSALTCSDFAAARVV